MINNGSQRIFIAIQGGAALGAYAWGMLDVLLDRPDLDIIGVSGTSSGATIGAFLVDGLLTGGRSYAKDRLKEAWMCFSEYICRCKRDSSPDLNRSIQGFLAEMDKAGRGINYKRLRKAKEPILLINATHIPPGECWEAVPRQHERVFKNARITADVIAASGSLVEFMLPVTVKNEALLDGAYCANPHLARAVKICFAQEAMLVVLRTRPTKAFKLDEQSRGKANWGRAFFNSLLDNELGKIAAKFPNLPIRVIQPSGVEVLPTDHTSDPDFCFHMSSLLPRHREGYLAAQHALRQRSFMPNAARPANYFAYANIGARALLRVVPRGTDAAPD
jgi:NTE family protein